MDMSAHATPGIEERVESIIRIFLEGCPANRVFPEKSGKAWGEPVIGFSSGADPLYRAFKEHIGPFYWTPSEIFNLTFPETPAEGEELTVISWVLPQTKATKAGNRRAKAYPCEEWARTRTFGEEVNNQLKEHLTAELKAMGKQAVAPTLSPHFSWQTSPGFGFASNWSERHAAHASGLGTFGLCDGLITPVGKAMRTGSIVARLLVPSRVKPYKGRTEYCLHFSDHGCRKCIERCPAGAITESGHDKEKCFEYIMIRVIPYIKDNYGFGGYSCGLCQTGVPCESRIPVRK